MILRGLGCLMSGTRERGGLMGVRRGTGSGLVSVRRGGLMSGPRGEGGV